MNIDTIGNIIAASIIAITIGVFLWLASPDPTVEYKINKCVTALPPQSTQPLERCTAFFALEGEK